MFMRVREVGEDGSRNFNEPDDTLIFVFCKNFFIETLHSFCLRLTIAAMKVCSSLAQ
jgi:hypothetical protein